MTLLYVNYNNIYLQDQKHYATLFTLGGIPCGIPCIPVEWICLQLNAVDKKLVCFHVRTSLRCDKSLPFVFSQPRLVSREH